MVASRGLSQSAPYHGARLLARAWHTHTDSSSLSATTIILSPLSHHFHRHHHNLIREVTTIPFPHEPLPALSTMPPVATRFARWWLSKRRRPVGPGCFVSLDLEAHNFDGALASVSPCDSIPTVALIGNALLHERSLLHMTEASEQEEPSWTVPALTVLDDELRAQPPTLVAKRLFSRQLLRITTDVFGVVLSSHTLERGEIEVGFALTSRGDQYLIFGGSGGRAASISGAPNSAQDGLAPQARLLEFRHVDSRLRPSLHRPVVHMPCKLKFYFYCIEAEGELFSSQSDSALSGVVDQIATAVVGIQLQTTVSRVDHFDDGEIIFRDSSTLQCNTTTG